MARTEQCFLLGHSRVVGGSRGESSFYEVENAFTSDSSKYAFWCPVDLFKESPLNLKQRIIVEVFCFDAEQEIVQPLVIARLQQFLV